MRYCLLTGNIGAGKSTVAEELRKVGLPVISADQMMKDIYRNDSQVRGTVIAKFGPDAFDPFGSLSQELRDKSLASRDVYTFLADLIRHPMSAMLAGIMNNLCLYPGGHDAVFVESATLDPWIWQWCRPESMPTWIFSISTSDIDARIERVVERYKKRFNIKTENYGFCVLPDAELEVNRNHLEEYRKMVRLTDKLQTDINTELLKNTPSLVKPSVMLNDEEGDARLIAMRINDICRL